MKLGIKMPCGNTNLIAQKNLQNGNHVAMTSSECRWGKNSETG